MKKQMAGARSPLTPLESQQLQRLRVNRAALVQELRVDGVLRSLAARGVLTNGDCDYVSQGRTERDRAQRLLDLLPTKGRQADWYRHFREALRTGDGDDDDAEAATSMTPRRSHRMLTDFLDSTLVTRLGAAVVGRRDQPSPPQQQPPPGAGPRQTAPSRDAAGTASWLPDDGTAGAASTSAPSSDDGRRAERAPLPGPRSQATAAGASTTSSLQGGGGSDAVAASVTVALTAAAVRQWSGGAGGMAGTATAPIARDSERHAAAERVVFSSMREIEAAHARTWARGLLPVGGDDGAAGGHVDERANESGGGSRVGGSSGATSPELDAVLRMVLDSDNRHAYLKYLVALRTIKSIDIVKDVATLFPALCERLTAAAAAAADGELTTEDRRLELLSTISSGLASLLQDLGSFDEAAAVLATAAGHLRRRTGGGDRSGSSSFDSGGGGGGGGARVATPILTWRLLYAAHVSTFRLLHSRGDFAGAGAAGARAVELRSKLELVSFGKRTVDGVSMSLHMHRLLRDTGHAAAAGEWLRTAVQELDFTDHRAVIKVLCTASQAYVFRGSLSRAETLVTHAVRLARKTFGTLHPLYVRALLHYVLFSNEVRQDDVGLAVARRLVALGERVHGPNTARAASLHRAAAAAALSTNGEADNGSAACRHARRALSTLLAALRGQAVPAVTAFRETLGLGLLKLAAATTDDDERESCLDEAEVELGTALDENEQWYGPDSYQVAMTCHALGRLMAQRQDWSSSARQYQRAIEKLSKCALPVGNSAIPMIKAALGCVYTSAGRWAEGVDLLEIAVNSYNTQSYPLKWYAAAYQSLATCWRAVGDVERARETEARLVAWSWDAEDHLASRSQALDGEPLHDLAALFSEANLWKGQYAKVLAGLKASMPKQQALNSAAETSPGATGNGDQRKKAAL